MGNSSSSSSSLEKRLELIDSLKRGPGSSYETGIKPDFKAQAKEYKRELRARMLEDERQARQTREAQEQTEKRESPENTNSKPDNPYWLCQRCYIGYIYRSGGGCDHCGNK